MPPNFGLAFAPRGGDGSDSLCAGARPRGVQVSASVVGVELFANCDGVPVVLLGEGFGVDCRSGDGDNGLSGRRNGDARLDPPWKEGLYAVVMIRKSRP